MSSSPLTTEKTTEPDLNTVAGVDHELKRELAAYKAAREKLFAQRQPDREHLRALLKVLMDREGETAEAGGDGQ